MKNRLKPLCRLIGVGTFGVVAAGAAHAAATCTTVGSSGSVGFTMAVASNFNAPAINLATTYANSQGYKIQVCQDSSGNIYNSITGGANNPPQYAVFFSADTDKPNNLANNTPLVVAGPTNYAQGIPVFLLSPAAASGGYSAVDYLNTGLASGATADGVANQVVLKRPGDSPSVDYLAIGDPGVAPYGVAAQQILTDMGLWSTSTDITHGAGSNVTTACSAMTGSTQWICTYNNIDNTLKAVDANSVTAGFVAYSQVCPVWAGATYATSEYVQFSSYPTLQSYVQLAVTDPAAQAKAAAFVASLGIGTASWNSWLANNCYQSL